MIKRGVALIRGPSRSLLLLGVLSTVAACHKTESQNVIVLSADSPNYGQLQAVLAFGSSNLERAIPVEN